MRIGIIGTGNIGQLLLARWINHPQATRIHAYNRTATKLNALRSTYPTLVIERTNTDVVRQCDWIVLGVKPREYPALIEEIQPHVRPYQLILAVTSPVTIAQLQRTLPCKIAKIIPSFTNRIQEGVVLVVHGDRLAPEDRHRLDELLGVLGTPKTIDDAHVRIASDFTSCAPAYIASLLQAWIKEAHTHTGISPAETQQYVALMLKGTAQLLTAGETLATIRQTICVPGGITAAGVRILDPESAALWNTVIHVTHAKFEEECTHLAQQFDRMISYDEVDQTTFGDDHATHGTPIE